MKEKTKGEPKSQDVSETIQIPKGMRDLIGGNYHHLQGFFEKAADTAIYYGFTPIETPILEKAALFSRGVGEETDIVEKEMYVLKTRGGDRLALRPEGTAPVIRAYFENGLTALPQPAMLYYFGPFFRHNRPQRGRWRQFWQFGLEIIGSDKSIADAAIIKTAALILQESGVSDLKIEINSIGDKSCRPNFRRDLVAYYRRQLKNICDDCRRRFKENPLRLLDCKNPSCQPAKENSPESIGYLCAACKNHFREVLEYLEKMRINYTINNHLVRGLDYYSRTVFEITAEDTAEDTAAAARTKNGEDKEAPAAPPLALASGGRYDYLARTLGFKKDAPAVGVAIGVDRVLAHPRAIQHDSRMSPKPKIFFIQLGFEAKLKSFAVIETLRKARIPLAQSLTKDSLAVQLAIAEKLQVPHSVILGQKEALEDAVIVRNMATRSQETVKIDELANYLKQTKKADDSLPK